FSALDLSRGLQPVASGCRPGSGGFASRQHGVDSQASPAADVRPPGWSARDLPHVAPLATTVRERPAPPRPRLLRPLAKICYSPKDVTRSPASRGFSISRLTLCVARLGGRVVMQRPAKPSTPVRFRP